VLPAALDGLAATHGPGSFTGVRIGLAAAQGLALGLSIPLVTVSTIDAVLAPLLTGTSLVAGVLDARRGEVYAGAARDPLAPDGAVPRVLADCVAAPDAAARDLAQAARRGERIVLAGSGAPLVADALAARGVAALCVPPAAAGRPGAVAWIGRARLLAGQRVAPDAVSPLYLRDANARTLAERAGAS